MDSSIGRTNENEFACSICGSEGPCFCEYEEGRCATCGQEETDCTCICLNGIDCEHPYCPEHSAEELIPDGWAYPVCRNCGESEGKHAHAGDLCPEGNG